MFGREGFEEDFFDFLDGIELYGCDCVDDIVDEGLRELVLVVVRGEGGGTMGE